MDDATFRIPMHGVGGFVSLDAILAVVDGASLEWHLVDIRAIAKRESGVDVLQLEEDVRAHPGGLALTDAALRALARQIDQVIDCEILGLRAERPDASTPDVSIVAFDSTEWIVRLSEAASSRLNQDGRLTLLDVDRAGSARREARSLADGDIVR
ncbi:hypothetical protein [Actinotalea subterranea]|uniref:hypothetical protein n=1 Tax=Actinotalea subterranea TaxID=2607497 RepID=UPI0011ECE8DE|nr:hypothetical protein [Actinotalea subterranea]